MIYYLASCMPNHPCYVLLLQLRKAQNPVGFVSKNVAVAYTSDPRVSAKKYKYKGLISLYFLFSEFLSVCYLFDRSHKRYANIQNAYPLRCGFRWDRTHREGEVGRWSITTDWRP